MFGKRPYQDLLSDQSHGQPLSQTENKSKVLFIIQRQVGGIFLRKLRLKYLVKGERKLKGNSFYMEKLQVPFIRIHFSLNEEIEIAQHVLFNHTY